MGKLAFIFPGQGAQYIGMGQGFYQENETARRVMDKASEVTGMDIPKLCFEPNEEINQTEYTQIAMVAVETALLRVVEERGIHPDFTAGLSLGEYSAIVAAGMMKEEDAFRVVRKRGIYMQEAVPTGGAMAAVLGMEQSVIEQACHETEGIVSIANYNCPGQIVITGKQEAVDAAGDRLKELGAKRVVPLRVSGPFHSALMEPAGEKLAVELADIEIGYGVVPYIANVTAEPVYTTNDVKPLLQKQVSASVRWQQSMEYLIENGVDTFVEIGPGKTLAGFARKINKDVKVFNVDIYEEFDKVMEELHEITG